MARTRPPLRSPQRGRVRIGVAVTALALAVGPARAAIPEAVPDLPVLGPQTPVGSIVTAPADSAAPTLKTIDGDISDWTGDITRLGGTSIYSRGEFVYQDFLMDAWGADDGADAQRLQTLKPAAETEPRTYRVDALIQAAGDQFGAPAPFGAQVHYGDAVPPPELRNQADIEEVRVAADPERLLFLARTSGMTQSPATAALILLDTEPGGSYAAPGLASTKAEWAFLVAGDKVLSAAYRGAAATFDCAFPCLPSGFEVATNPGQAGADNEYDNAIEVSISRAALAQDSALPTSIGVGVATGVVDSTTEPTGLARVATGDGKSDLLNVAFRNEPARVRMDQEQALALHDGTIDRFMATVDLGKLAGGCTQTFRPRPGYYERIYLSHSAVNREAETDGSFQGAFQPYGLYVPMSYRPGTPNPATYWLHFNGGRGNDAAAWVPGIIRQLGEDRGNIVISPNGRGTGSAFVGRAHEDFLEVWDDAMAWVNIDPDRVFLSGYSMGGFGAYLIGLLYPDRFAAAFPTSGTTVAGPPDVFRIAEGGDEAPLDLINILENARNLPYVMYHGGNDELIPVTNAVLAGARLAQLGYQYRLYAFPGYEHYSFAIVDEWKAAARYLDGFRRDPDPARVTYRVWPALEHVVETESMPSGATIDYNFDGAYWIDELRARDGDPADPKTFGSIDAQTLGRGARQVLGLPEAGTVELGQFTPFVMTGMRWASAGAIAPSNAFSVTLANIADGRLDVARMGLGTAAPITATVTTDGPTTLRLAGTWADPPTVTGAPGSLYENGELAVSFSAAGTYALAIQP
ncbi:MAG: prolyl oligopeptidase family serine peptidase [Actinomycetota bacterium]